MKKEDFKLLSMLSDNEEELFPIITDGEDIGNFNNSIPDEAPILPLRNLVVFPGVVTQISIGRHNSHLLIKEAYEADVLIGTVAQRISTVENPSFNDIYQIGTLAKIIKIIEMPNGAKIILIQGQKRFSIISPTSVSPYFRAKIVTIEEDSIDSLNSNQVFDVVLEAIKDIVIKITKLAHNFSQEMSFAVKNIENKKFLINFICHHCQAKLEEKQRLLEITSLNEKANELLKVLSEELQVLELKEDIQQKVRNEMDKQQKEYYLSQQIKAIQKELGGNPSDREIKELQERAKNKEWGINVQEIFEKEIKKLSNLNPAIGEFSMELNYLDLILELPWEEVTEDKVDVAKAEEILNKDHYGLEKVKERIIEHIAILKIKNNLKSPIICLCGPPGVGKTSLGKSVAESIGRNYVRISLGGLHDESELRGHRRTYIGAMPGQIIKNIKKAKTSNPVFVLDEIDKVGGLSVHGDPQSALLEILDPEQNTSFHDNYLDIDYDLSKVLFIATANDISKVIPPLRDRMELIEINGYILEEKLEIAKRHLVKKQLKECGLNDDDIIFNNQVLTYLIEGFTLESGVRSLEKNIGSLIRKIVKKITTNEKYNKELSVEDVRNMLGEPKFSKDRYENNKYAGVVTGLAWTSVGGDILFMETLLYKGTGKLTLTGNLGDVMKESATIALDYVKAKADIFGINSSVFDKWDVHIHVPEGAVPKDGPSAGITMATSIVSAFTQRKVKEKLAMTGEITLRGKVLPVGGIREKILAAKRAEYTEIILCHENKKNIDEIPKKYLEGINFHYIEKIDDVIEIALVNELVDNPINIS